MKVLDCFYVQNSGGFMQLVEYNNQYYIGWRISDSIESDKFDYACLVFSSLEEALKKFEELREEELSWR